MATISQLRGGAGDTEAGMDAVESMEEPGALVHHRSAAESSRKPMLHAPGIPSGSALITMVLPNDRLVYILLLSSVDLYRGKVSREMGKEGRSPARQATAAVAVC
ncbi:hypothetical protein U9M48_019259 [Paspalum notatum var. saurae]|uniref:Uncharacterized protein n=1 Tax=Paspalum notatum var. saurae TaxID=547442 RepID=A0AAQ3TDB3_PASNO